MMTAMSHQDLTTSTHGLVDTVLKNEKKDIYKVFTQCGYHLHKLCKFKKGEMIKR